MGKQLDLPRIKIENEMAQNSITQDDLLAFEVRMKHYLDIRPELVAFELRMKQYLDLRLKEADETPQQLFYTVTQVAKMTSLSRNAIRHRLCDPNEKHLKGIQPQGVNATWMIPKESLDAFISSIKRNRP